MKMDDSDVLGEGTSSICRRGVDEMTGKEVAIKVYKKKRGVTTSVTLKKFRRQIAVLQQLQTPLAKPTDPRLWAPELQDTDPSRIFVQLLDYSTDTAGHPGPDATDKVMYVVTEMASFSLKDFIKDRREQRHRPSAKTIQILARQMVLVVAGLHARGLVHLDLKPENLMVFDGLLKLIDVDGCVKIGEQVSCEDSSISFSPCYCAPEWAKFVCDELESTSLVISPALDVWSIALTIAELVTLDAVLKDTYASFLKHGRSHQDAACLFMEWLAGRVDGVPLPKEVQQHDAQLLDLLSKWLLVARKRRKTLAEALQHPYLVEAQLARSVTSPVSLMDMPASLERTPRRRRNVDRSQKVLFQGVMWKLNRDGDIKCKHHWLQRDMWITVDCSLGYFSQKESKKLILLDGSHLAGARVKKLSGTPFKDAFEVLCTPGKDELRESDHFRFGCVDERSMNEWIYQINEASTLHSDHRMDIVAIAKDLKALKQNRRKTVDRSSSNFEPAFKAKLWKLKIEGDTMNSEDWYSRDMWLSNNGSLVYHSVKEEKDLIYYADQDIHRSKIEKLTEGKTCKPWSFKILLPAVGDVHIAPGVFAASTEDERERWLKEFQKAGAKAIQ
jgi:serine/threonine protein kinase